MWIHSKRIAVVLIAVLAAACSNNGAVPPAQSGAPSGASQDARSSSVTPADNTSILKKFKKDVVIGSTVDPGNGDTGPHSISIVQSNYGLKKGQLIVCNFADSSGNAGKGTTIELLDPKPGSKPSTFAQSNQIEGCDAAATTEGNNVCAAGLTSGVVACFDQHGNIGQTYGSPLAEPFDDVDAHCVAGQKGFCGYSAEYIFASDAKTGGIVNWSINQYGNPHETQVVSGFAENKKSGWSALGPSGLSYSSKLDELYVADGVNNTVDGITHAGSLLAPNEVVVLKGGKKFKCKYHGKGDPCGQLIFAGKPLNAPEAMTVLPNGNLVVANTAGGNTLVEIDVSTGKVLATKTVDKGTSPAIFAVLAAGKNDTNTVLYYTDNNDNSLHELEQ